jgi:hypothetical protein
MPVASIPVYVPPAPAAHIAPIEVYAASVAAPSHSVLSRDGFKSFATGDALTIDDIVKGLSRESGMVFSQHLEEEAPAPMPAYEAPVAMPKEEAKLERVAPAFTLSQEAPANIAPAIVYSDDVSGFLSALLSGDRDTVFGTLRNVNRAGGDTQDFLAHAVCALDDAYRARIDGTSVHPEIARITSDCATNFLERLVSSLATAIDASYSAGLTGSKLAITRALAVVNG